MINLNTIFKILATLLIISMIVLFSSCGAKKTDKTTKSDSSILELTDKSQSEQLEESKANVDTNVKKSETLIISDKDQTTTVEETVEPVDASKPSSYTDKDGKKQELHNSKKTTKTTVKNNNTNINSNSNAVASVKSGSEINKKINNNANIKIKAAAKKNETDVRVDRKAWSMWNLWWLLIVPVALGIRWIWKNKAEIAAKMWWV